MSLCSGVDQARPSSRKAALVPDNWLGPLSPTATLLGKARGGKPVTLRILLILVASACIGVALGLASSTQDGFFGALGIATLLHAMIEPKSKSPEKKAISGAESLD
ncbi:hypothetical protein ABZ744_00570 [Micromonospora chersina]|uniref:hypothetical protein n=1 Tax=Micromonospora chersina TaxID=47854 RepID=UPI003404A7DD